MAASELFATVAVVVKDGAFRDAFQPWDVHLYRIAPR